MFWLLLPWRSRQRAAVESGKSGAESDCRCWLRACDTHPHHFLCRSYCFYATSSELERSGLPDVSLRFQSSGRLNPAAGRSSHDRARCTEPGDQLVATASLSLHYPCPGDLPPTARYYARNGPALKHTTPFHSCMRIPDTFFQFLTLLVSFLRKNISDRRVCECNASDWKVTLGQTTWKYRARI